MNPLAQEALGSIVRATLLLLSGWFVQHGIWTDTDAEKYVGAAALAILAVGWSVWQKYKSRLKLVTALASSRPMSENAAASIAQYSAPSTMTASDTVPTV